MSIVKNGDNQIYTYTVGDNVFTSEQSEDDVWRKAMTWQYEQGIKTLEEIELEYGLFTSRDIINIPYTIQNQQILVNQHQMMV